MLRKLHVRFGGGPGEKAEQSDLARGLPYLAVLIHTRAQELVAPTPSPAKAGAAAEPPAAPSAPAKAPCPTKPRRSAAWDVHEAPVSSCFKIRVGALEWTHTMRATDDAELHTRVQAFVPTFRAVVAALDALHAEREAAKAAPAPQAPPAPQPASAPADLETLIQQALAAHANGAAPSPPAPAAPSTGQRQAKPKTGDQATGVCSLHTVGMEHHDNERGSWYSHWLPEDERHCKGRR